MRMRVTTLTILRSNGRMERLVRFVALDNKALDWMLDDVPGYAATCSCDSDEEVQEFPPCDVHPSFIGKLLEQYIELGGVLA